MHNEEWVEMWGPSNLFAATLIRMGGKGRLFPGKNGKWTKGDSGCLPSL